ncbi:hypothetical protein NMG60_11028190 [Bertholletia excelsa]
MASNPQSAGNIPNIPAHILNWLFGRMLSWSIFSFKLDLRSDSAHFSNHLFILATTVSHMKGYGHGLLMLSLVSINAEAIPQLCLHKSFIMISGRLQIDV